MPLIPPPPSTHAVVGTAANGRRLYYTGRAGQGFVSPNPGDALIGWYESGAQYVAKRLNEWTPIHGIKFEPAPVESLQ